MECYLTYNKCAEFPPYSGRISEVQLSQDGVSFVLMSVSKEDSGQYMMLLSGPGAVDRTKLYVHQG